MPPPGRLKKPPPAVDVPTPGLPGWVNVRLNGCAEPGAVDVLGGAEKVRVPRDPDAGAAANSRVGRRDGQHQRQCQRQDHGKRLNDSRARAA